ncbi:SDR family oxidoreductase [Ectobacillus ponti]|uniref:SDR family oxidoreductase n=1 Tax=Ectobacillus ponti TaxID=2961894 RepID=A0AA41XAV3_9BACI|nr:SDR family oxidoreductase [Ectobacillus ponti]MCP8969555.1 SDR family oxidoreductase [Ectobacillus ponti]
MNNRIALVTGAGRAKGIGAAICRSLADAGMDIFFTYWSSYDASMPWGAGQEEPLQLREDIRRTGARCEMLELDLSDPAAPGQLMEAVCARLGTPDVLVNNAAYSTSTSYADITAEELDRHYFINVRATALLSAAFARRFEKGNGGRIINLTSGQSLGPMPNEVAYAATKGAVDALTVTLSAELAPKGITVNAVNPGPTDTGWMTPELQEELLPLFGLGRIGLPADAARAVRLLASEDAGWITGQILHSEGGFKR